MPRCPDSSGIYRFVRYRIGARLELSDTTVVIPALEEQGVWDVVSETRRALPGSKILVMWKGYNNRAPVFRERG